MDGSLVCGLGLVIAVAAAGCDGASSGSRGDGVEAGAGGGPGGDAGSGGASSGGASSGGAEPDAGSGGASSGGAGSGGAATGGAASGGADGGVVSCGEKDLDDDPANCGQPGNVCPAVVIAADRKEPVAMAIHGSDLYWIDAGSFTGEDCQTMAWQPNGCLFSNGHSANDGVLARVPLGGGAPVVLAEGLADPRYLFVDSTGAHVAVQDGILSVPLAGGEPQRRFAGQAWYAAADESSFYVAWAVEDVDWTWTTHLTKVPRDGSEPVALGELSGSPRGFAMDGTHVYVLLLDLPTRLQKVPVDGGPAVTVTTLTDGDGPLLVADGRAFFRDAVLGATQLLQVPTSGGTATHFAEPWLLLAATAPSTLWFTAGSLSALPASPGLFRLPLAEGCSPVRVGPITDRVTAVTASGDAAFWTTAHEILPTTRPAPGVSLHRPGQVMRAGRCVNAICE